MRDGYVKVAAITPNVKVCDVDYNCKEIIKGIKEASKKGVKIMVFPELCITGYTCGDLFLQEILPRRAKEGLKTIAKATEKVDAIVFVGLPLVVKGKLYNCAAAVCKGEVLGMVPKTYLPNYNEFYEGRHFKSGEDLDEDVLLYDDEWVNVSRYSIFSCEDMPELKIGCEICEDLWTPDPPSVGLAKSGATIIVNLSASDEITGKDTYRKSLVTGQSARLICGYIYASAGDGESTQDVVYSGHNIIAENGTLLAESERFKNGMIISEIDVKRLVTERRRMSTFDCVDGYEEVDFSLKISETKLTRYLDKTPFVPSSKSDRDKRCDEILMIQSMGLKKRLEHTGCKAVAIGISGGLDSTLALLVTVRAFDILGLDRKGIKAVTMPGFGTTDRTYDNAVSLIECLGTSFLEVSIKNAVNVHFEDIGQDPDNHDITYENSQARERTQILMDIANKNNGMVIGTGDLSELALGWATYNGDHMSMYGVNASVPKTLVRHLVRYYADTCGDEELKKVLLDVLDTPVSPELLPPKDGKISQKTEDVVGPYELHDFFLYNMLRQGFSPKKIFRLTCEAWGDVYDRETILKWLTVFSRRFFSQQFKRSCLPDGPKVGSVAVSPRGDLRMPSDASNKIWMEELNKIGDAIQER
ncbi:MAG: NAD(+) synthase [Lachnospiraceae bacterium]|nr:NAD(+) synthase [Lachnospiraceae bacterium]